MKDVCSFPLKEFHRFMLPPEERGLYDLLLGLLRSGGGECTYHGRVDSDVLGRVYQAIYDDAPETYRLDQTQLFSCASSPLGGWKFSPNYALNATMDTILNNHASRIIQAAKDNCRTDLEKELYVHDWFADNVEYTFEGYASEESEYGVYGAIVEHKAVCMGISKAVSMILNRLGVDCGTYSDHDDKHMWNIVRLDGECYHLDVTWDMRDSHGHTVYDFFNLNDMEMSRYHHVCRGAPASGSRYNWYRMNGLEARQFSDIVRILGEAVHRKDKTVVFRNLAVPADKAIDTVFSILKDFRRVRSYSCSNSPETGRVEVTIGYRSDGICEVPHDHSHVQVAQSPVNVHGLPNNILK